MISGARSVIHGAAAVLIAAILAAASAAAAGEWGLDALMQALGEVKSASGRFVERKELAMLDAPLEVSGTLSYSAPDHLEKRTLAPAPSTLIVDAGVLHIEEGRNGKRRAIALGENPAVWALVESIRATLAGDLPTLRRFYQVRLEGAEPDWRLVLTPRDPGMRAMVQEIRIGGSANHVTSVETVEAGGDRSRMIITPQAP